MYIKNADRVYPNLLADNNWRKVTEHYWKRLKIPVNIVISAIVFRFSVEHFFCGPQYVRSRLLLIFLLQFLQRVCSLKTDQTYSMTNI